MESYCCEDCMRSIPECQRRNRGETGKYTKGETDEGREKVGNTIGSDAHYSIFEAITAIGNAFLHAEEPWHAALYDRGW